MKNKKYKYINITLALLSYFVPGFFFIGINSFGALLWFLFGWIVPLFVLFYLDYE